MEYYRTIASTHTGAPGEFLVFCGATIISEPVSGKEAVREVLSTT